MSSNLTYEIVRDRDLDFFDDELKHKLRDSGLFGDPVDHVFTEDDIPFLQGLKVCNVKNAYDLICLIEKHGRIRVKEEWL